MSLSCNKAWATSLVLAHPELISAAVNPLRKAENPFTIVLHGDPELDAASAAGLAIAY